MRLIKPVHRRLLPRDCGAIYGRAFAYDEFEVCHLVELEDREIQFLHAERELAMTKMLSLINLKAILRRGIQVDFFLLITELPSRLSRLKRCLNS